MSIDKVRSFFNVLLSIYAIAGLFILKSNYGNMDTITGLFIGMSAFMATMGFAWNIGIQLRKLID